MKNLIEWAKDIIAGLLLILNLAMIYFYLIILFPGSYY